MERDRGAKVAIRARGGEDHDGDYYARYERDDPEGRS